MSNDDSRRASASSAGFHLHGNLRVVEACVAVLAVILLAIWLAVPRNPLFAGIAAYLPFHIFVETFSITVSVMIFGVAWNARSTDRPAGLVVLSCAMLAAGLVDFAHMLSVQGMPTFVSPSGPNKGITFWLAARLLAAIGLAAAAWRPVVPLKSPYSRHLLLALFLGITGLMYWFGLYERGVLPRFFVAGKGLTTAKIAAEYLIIAILIIPAGLFYRLSRRDPSPFFVGLFAAAAVSILSELYFTLYAATHDLFQLFGHIYKIIAYLFIYRAVFIEGVRAPFERLEHEVRLRTDTQAALQRSEARYRSLFENMDDGYGLHEIVLDAQGRPHDYRFLEVNPAFERMLGFGREAVVGKTVRELLPGIPQHWIERFGQVALTGRGVRFEEHAESLGRYFEVTAVSPQRGIFAAIFRDVSERKRAEDTLRANEQLFRLAFDHFPGSIAVYDSERRFKYINAFGRHATGLSLEQHVGRRDEEIRPPEAADAFLPLLIKCFETRRPQLREAWVSLPTGEYAMAISYIPILTDRGEIDQVLGIALDITGRKRSEEELRTANEQLNKALQELRATQQQVIQSEKLAALGTLAAGVAHELNNPLMGVMGYVTFARNLVQDQKARELLEKAGRELQRMRDLIKNMLGFSRPIIEGELAPVSIPAVLERALGLMQSEFKVRDIRVTTEIVEDVPEVLANADMLQQVFINLLMNARDAVENAPRRQIDITVCRTDTRVEINFADRGPGIPPDIQGRIFDPFFTTKPPGKGTGLGLSIARNIMADLRGTLASHSREGAGATFAVALPLPPGQAKAD